MSSSERLFPKKKGSHLCFDTSRNCRKVELVLNRTKNGASNGGAAFTIIDGGGAGGGARISRTSAVDQSTRPSEPSAVASATALFKSGIAAVTAAATAPLVPSGTTSAMEDRIVQLEASLEQKTAEAARYLAENTRLLEEVESLKEDVSALLQFKASAESKIAASLHTKTPTHSLQKSSGDPKETPESKDSGEYEVEECMLGLEQVLASANLTSFYAQLYNLEVRSLRDLKQRGETFLTTQLGFDLPQLRKFERARDEAEASSREIALSVYEAVDGFRGTLKQCTAHEQQLAKAQGLHFEDGDVDLLLDTFGLGQFKRTLNTLHVKTISDFKKTSEFFLIQSAGFGAFHLRKRSSALAAVVKEESLDLYVTDDGFRGSLQDCIEHEKLTGKLSAFNLATIPLTEESLELYETDDGFRGTLEDCLAHERLTQQEVTPPQNGATKFIVNDVDSQTPLMNSRLRKLSASRDSEAAPSVRHPNVKSHPEATASPLISDGGSQATI